MLLIAAILRGYVVGNISVILASNDVTGMTLLFVVLGQGGDGLVPQKIKHMQRESFLWVHLAYRGSEDPIAK